MQGECPFGIFGAASGEPLAGEIRRSSKRVADADVSLFVDVDARHRAEEGVRSVGALLVQERIARLVEAKLVPAHAATARMRVDGVRRDDGLLFADPAVDQALHELVALHVQPDVSAGLRDAVRQLAIAKIMIGRDRNFHGPVGARLRGVAPVDVDFPEVDSVVLEDFFELPASSGQHDVGRAGGRDLLAVDIGVVQEIYTLDHKALLPGRLACKHLVAFGDADMFFDYRVASTCWDIVAVGPDGRAWIVGEEFALEGIAIVGAERIRSCADGVAHPEGPFGRVYGFAWFHAGFSRQRYGWRRR